MLEQHPSQGGRCGVSRSWGCRCRSVGWICVSVAWLRGMVISMVGSGRWTRPYLAFPVEQLVELQAADGRAVDTDVADTNAGRARREVGAPGGQRGPAGDDRYRAGPRSMITGHYGCRHACHADIPLAVLEVIPQAGLCLGCQRSESDLR